jgi:2-oxoisovalerate dehydrogenase E2 component (dihydrolipoyl transacylase)
MATEIKMPQLGESVTEGTVGRWLKQPGDPVAKYEPLLEVITDKVDSEVPAPLAGTLLEILVPEGETVRVGTVIARLGTAEDAATAPASASAASAKATATPTPAAASSAASASTSSAAASSTSSAAATPPPTNTFVPPMADAAPGANNAPGAFLSPVVARLLAEHGLDQSAINGSGQGGRITKQDVLRQIAARSAAPAISPPPTTEAPGSQAAAPGSQAAAPGSLPSSFIPHPSSLSPQPSEDPHPSSLSPQPSALSPHEDAELVPLSPMRRAIAEHMERSVRTAPHVTTVVELDMSQVAAHRAAQQAAFARQGVRLTYTAYFAQAVATALGRVPVLNGSFSSEGIVLHRRIHLGIAVALDEGLIVPVVRDADEKNLLGLARAVGDLAERARTRRLHPEETQGGTFTLTNHGVTGSLFATPIINQPQAAILGIGAIVKRPVVVSQNGSDAIAIRPICYLSLTFDHRITDGANADSFLAVIKQSLEHYVNIADSR